MPPPPPANAQIRAEMGAFLADPPSISWWAESHVKIVDGPLVPAGGQAVSWNTDAFPPQVAVIGAIEDPRWARVVVMSAPQCFGKTLCAAIPPLLHGIHARRVNVVYVAASADLANAQFKDKIRPVLAADPDLAALIPGNVDFGGNRLHREFTNGTVMHVVGAESVGNLSGKTAPVVICDDVQAYPSSLGPRFGHPADYAITRAGSFPTEQRTLVFLGTAGTVEDWLWRTLSASACFCLFVPCLGCGRYQLVDFERFVYAESDLVAAKGDTWMRCAATGPECRHEIRFEELPAMLAESLWVSMPPAAKWVTAPPAEGVTVDPATADVYPDTGRNTNAAGFWCSAYYWPYGMTWGEHAAAWIGRRGNPDMVKDYRQNTRVIPWEEPTLDEDALAEDDVHAHASAAHHWKTIPEAAGVHDGTGVLILAADVQAGYLWYLVEAWHLATGSSWFVEAGRLGKKISPEEVPDKRERKRLWKSRVARALDDLAGKDAAGWPVISPGGEALATGTAALGLIDCSFLRETVQLFCKRMNRGRWLGKWLPIEGSQKKARNPLPVWPGLRRGPIERKTKRRYWECNTNRAKLYVREVLAVPPGTPGALHLPGDAPDFIRSSFAKHLCAEEWDAARGAWVQVAGENHLLDAQALQIVAAIASKVRLPSFEEAPKVQIQSDYGAAPSAGTGGGSEGWKIGR